MNKYISCLLVLLGFIASCNYGYQTISSSELRITATFPSFETYKSCGTKTAFSPLITYEKSIGVFPHSVSMGQNQSTPQAEFSHPSFLNEQIVSYVGAMGWSFHNDGNYNYVAYYPYSEDSEHDDISISYANQVQNGNDDTHHLGEFDYLYSTGVLPVNKYEASFTMNHIGCAVKINLHIPNLFGGHRFSKMVLYSDDDLFTISASYNISTIVNDISPVLDNNITSNQFQLSFGENGIVPENQIITAYFMMIPAALNGRTIKVRLYDSQNELAWIAEGDIVCAENQLPGNEYTYSVNMREGSPFPDEPDTGQTLNILLLGHSFGIDCTEYLPEIIHAANIQNVYIGRFYYANCSLQRYYNYISNPSLYYAYEYSSSDSPSWHSVLNPTLQNVIQSKPWDIVVFQQFIGNDGEGDYSSYQPYLDSLISYFTEQCHSIHNKVPLFAWNLFWSFSNPASRQQQISMYNNYVYACKQMMNHTGICCVIPPGTAFENLRRTEFNTINKNEFLRDGTHASYCIGRYLASCAWFESIIKPIYGIAVYNNTFRPNNHSFPEDDLTEDDYPLMWECARAAVASPFSITSCSVE